MVTLDVVRLVILTVHVFRSLQAHKSVLERNFKEGLRSATIRLISTDRLAATQPEAMNW